MDRLKIKLNVGALIQIVLASSSLFGLCYIEIFTFFTLPTALK